MPYDGSVSQETWRAVDQKMKGYAAFAKMMAWIWGTGAACFIAFVIWMAWDSHGAVGAVLVSVCVAVMVFLVSRIRDFRTPLYIVLAISGAGTIALAVLLAKYYLFK